MYTQCLLFILESRTKNLQRFSKGMKSSAAAVSSAKGYALFPEVFKEKHTEIVQLFEQKDLHNLSDQNVSNLLLQADKLEVIELLLPVSPASLDCLSHIVTDNINEEAISRVFRNITVYDGTPFEKSIVSPAVEEKNFKIIKQIILHKANIHVRHHLDESFLHMAAKRGPESLVNLLLEHGANVEARRRDGATPLHLAVLNGTVPIVQLLLQYGADVQAQTDDGKTPLHAAVDNGLAQMVQLLVINGAIVNCEYKYECTALSIAVRRGSADITEMLLVYGAEVNGVSDKGRPPISMAITCSRFDLIEVLLKFGAKINTEFKHGTLTLASQLCLAFNPQVFQHLLESCFLDPKLLEESCIAKRFLDRLGASSQSGVDFKLRCRILACHIVKIKALNLYHFADGIDASLLWTETVPTFIEFQSQCEMEVACMKSQTLGDTDLFLYDILAADASKVARFLRNDSVATIFTSNQVQEKYPIYESILTYHFKKGIERKSLLAKCMKICQFLFCHFRKLPDEIRDKILGYLSVKDLLVLKFVCGHLDVSP